MCALRVPCGISNAVPMLVPVFGIRKPVMNRVISCDRSKQVRCSTYSCKVNTRTSNFRQALVRTGSPGKRGSHCYLFCPRVGRTRFALWAQRLGRHEPKSKSASPAPTRRPLLFTRLGICPQYSYFLQFVHCTLYSNTDGCDDVMM